MDQNISLGKAKENSSRPGHRWYDNFIAEFSDMGHADVDWTYVA
jgi:hypothetical protein